MGRERGICSLLNIKRIARKLESTDGAEIAEAALVLPLVFMFLLGIVWFGRAFNIYSTIQQAAQQGAITAARESCATCGNDPSDPATVDNALWRCCRHPVSIPARSSSARPNPGLLSVSARQRHRVACTATSNNIWVCRTVQLNSSAVSQPAPMWKPW